LGGIFRSLLARDATQVKKSKAKSVHFNQKARLDLFVRGNGVIYFAILQELNRAGRNFDIVLTNDQVVVP
jgi:hypothetical protein